MLLSWKPDKQLLNLSACMTPHSLVSVMLQVLGLTFRRHGWLCVLLATFLLCG